VVWGWQVLLPPLNALLALLSHLTGATPPHLTNIFQQAPTRPPPMRPAIPERGGRPPGLWLWLTAHWPGVLAVAAVALGALLWSRRTAPQQRGFWPALLREVLRELRELLLLLWRPARRGVARALETATAGARRVAPRRAGEARVTGDLAPRQAVIALYMSMLALAARRGHARLQGQTPREYRDRLGAALPEVDADLRELTDLFVRARYDAAPVGAERLTRAQQLWRSLRGTLRRARRG
jgi:hypothetical protein